MAKRPYQCRLSSTRLDGDEQSYRRRRSRDRFARAIRATWSFKMLELYGVKLEIRDSPDEPWRKYEVK